MAALATLSSLHNVISISIVASLCVVSCHCYLNSSITVDAPGHGTAKVSYASIYVWSLMKLHLQTDYRLIGTNIHMLLLFRKLMATVLIGTYIHRVLLIDGYYILSLFSMKNNTHLLQG